MSKTTDAPVATGSTAKPRRQRSRLPRTMRNEAGNGPLSKHWRNHFLAALAETSNVAVSAERAAISVSAAYKVRREDGDFAARWRTALHEGYENLEMEMLGYLRNPDPDRKMDVAAAIRLMSLHKDEVARHRTLGDNRSEQEVLDSIDAMIDKMRERAAANALLLLEADAGGNDEAE